MKPTKSLGFGRERGQLPAVTSGLGVHFTTPTKGRRAPSRKTKKLASSALDFNARKRRLDAQLAAVVASAAQFKDLPDLQPSDPAAGAPTYDLEDWEACELGTITEEPDGIYPGAHASPIQQHHPPHSPIQPVSAHDPPAEPKPKRLKPDQAALNQAEKWNNLLPSLFTYGASKGLEIRSISKELTESCPSFSCHDLKSTKVLAIYFGHFISTVVIHCSCRTTPQVLVKGGLFPTAPSQIRMAFSIDFLDFYASIFQRSCDAVNAMAAALNTFNGQRGFNLLNKKDEKFREPFRKGLGYAAQWLDMLHVFIERSVEDALGEADSAIQEVRKMAATDYRGSTKSSTLDDLDSDDLDYAHGPQISGPLDECSRILRQLCPACFGSAKFGRTFDESVPYLDPISEVIFTFVHYHHLVSGGQGVPFHNPRHIIPKSFVDEVGRRIDEARKRKPKPRTSKVPDEAIDECQDSYNAADGDKKRGSGQRYDAQGWMSLICRHDIPLFFANIDTPGEQQRFSIALIIWFFYHIPRNATANVLYDIGCVLERSTQLAARRVWMTDRRLTFIAVELRDGLGDWIKNRLHRGVKTQGGKARLVLANCGFSVTELQAQWELQKEAQLSVRALYFLFRLSSKARKAIQTIQSNLSSAPKKTTRILKGLLEAQYELIDDLEGLYGSLNIQDSFPDLHGVELEFVRVLLLARDQKIAIRKQAIGSFFEWDRLDQAVGGRNQALGTKLHQQTRKAISQRQPSLISAIKRYNRYCEQLEELHDPSYKIPLPTALPTKLDDLRQDSNLMEDVWIELSEVETPLWLEDQDVRTGIRAKLKADRCKEEQRRLGWEADNLCRWFGREFAAVAVALRTPKNMYYIYSLHLYHLSNRIIHARLFSQLASYRDHLLHLKTRWTNPLASTIRFDAHIEEADNIANQHRGPAEASPTWLSRAVDVEDVHMAPLRYVFMSREDEEEVFGADDADAPLDVGDVILSDTLLDDDDCDEGRDLQDTSDITCKDGSIVFPCLIAVRTSMVWFKFLTKLERQGIERNVDDGLIRELNSLRLPPSLGPHDSNKVIGPFVFDKTDIGRLAEFQKQYPDKGDKFLTLWKQSYDLSASVSTVAERTRAFNARFKDIENLVSHMKFIASFFSTFSQD
ncbi:hypothetical protein CVT26_003865 [Gymnopilus dilepis]|uniref:CxC1-like cysteine cluster associated with KDZ transposases domain-containing protein n=1 Tax=Gymnopilus dilepis TaxID=231916 RepID=A0A409YUY0_9AGAR|nr:hypothetical protein CVT26_003865 [Gymnopilus dilepis]